VIVWSFLQTQAGKCHVGGGFLSWCVCVCVFTRTS